MDALQTMNTVGILSPSRCQTSLITAHSFLPHPRKGSKCFSFISNVISFPVWKQPQRLSFNNHPLSGPRTSISASLFGRDREGSKTSNEDLLTKILKENPSQVEPKFLIGNKLYTLKEKENLGKSENAVRAVPWFDLKKLLKSPGKGTSATSFVPVYLKDILKPHKGKLFVPEQVFNVNLSEEMEFDRNLRELPQMSFQDFLRHMECDKIKLLTFKEKRGSSFGYKDFVVDLKEIPGDKRLHRTKWVMRLNENEVKYLFEECTFPRYEIEGQIMSVVGNLPEHPHPVAAYISSRIMVELGMLTTVIAAAAVIVGGFMASAVFAAASFVIALFVYVVWPIVRPIVKFFLGILVGVLEQIWDKIIDMLSVISSKFYEIYAFGGVSASLEILKPMILVLLIMILVARFTLSRRPKNFKLWDIWQSIEFSRSKADARVDGSTGVKFNDIAGIDEAVEELQELVKYLKNPELFDQMGIKPPHGVLLEGPPGCGKTLVAKAIAGEAGVPFYQMAGSEFVELLVGVGSARIRDLFKRAKVNKPSVIFIDEIDALATRRQGVFKESADELYNAATQERETTLNQLLIELDGFDTGKGVIFLAATNRMDLLDPALLRPGRFDRKIRVRPPNEKGRLQILTIHSKKVKMSESVDLSIYAQNLPGWTGAKLAQVLQEAALVAVRKGHKSIVVADMDDAVDRLTVGPKRVGLELGHQGQCRRATTEVGVALTSHLLRQLENAKVERCSRISIIPRGRTLSQVVFDRLDDESYKFERLPQLLHRLQVFLGGRAAEEVIYGHDTSIASVSYLADASWLARKILTIWNLESPMVIHGEAAPWRKGIRFAGPRLDFEGSLYDDYGLTESFLSRRLDDEVAKRTEELVGDMYGKTLALLTAHHAALLKTVKVLLNQQQISGEEMDFILDTYPPETPISILLAEKNPGNIPLVFLDN